MYFFSGDGGCSKSTPASAVTSPKRIVAGGCFGGPPAAGGGYTLHSTAGQPEPGPALTGGSFTLTGGFWPAGLESSGGGGDVYLPLIMKQG